MKITEVIRDGQTYKARIRIEGVTVSIWLTSDSMSSVRALIAKCYGKSALVSLSQVLDEEQDIGLTRDIRQVSTQPVAYDKKREVLQKLLQQKMLKHSNIVRPGFDDLAIAGAQVASDLKRANYEHEKEVEQSRRKEERQQRRRSRNA